MAATHPRRPSTEEEEEKGVGGRRQGSPFPPDVLSALTLMFDGLDVDCDGVLSREEVSGCALRVVIIVRTHFRVFVSFFRKTSGGRGGG